VISRPQWTSTCRATPPQEERDLKAALDAERARAKRVAEEARTKAAADGRTRKPRCSGSRATRSESA